MLAVVQTDKELSHPPSCRETFRLPEEVAHPHEDFGENRLAPHRNVESAHMSVLALFHKDLRLEQEPVPSIGGFEAGVVHRMGRLQRCVLLGKPTEVPLALGEILVAVGVLGQGRRHRDRTAKRQTSTSKFVMPMDWTVARLE